MLCGLRVFLYLCNVWKCCPKNNPSAIFLRSLNIKFRYDNKKLKMILSGFSQTFVRFANDTFTFIFGKLEIKINCFGTPFYKCSFQCPLIYYIVLHKNIARSIIPERKKNMKGFYVYLGIIDYPIVHAKLWIVHNGTRLNKKISMTCWENNNNINSTS